MHRIHQRIVLVLALVSAAFLPSACTNAGNGPSGERSAIVCGTVVDAATGKPVADVLVEGPLGKDARSDEKGRFELGSFEVGTTGEVKAKTSDGRMASVPLRRLLAGKLEVVLNLRKQ